MTLLISLQKALKLAAEIRKAFGTRMGDWTRMRDALVYLSVGEIK